MRREALDILRCPECGAPFSPEPDALVCTAGHHFDVVDDLPRLVHPPELLPSDAEFQSKYDATADDYDEGSDWLFKAFRAEEADVRGFLVGLLELRSGARVVETGCGTGRDSRVILDRIGPDGSLYALDISAAMLEKTRERLRGVPGAVELVHANAAHLPFADDVFDAAFHFGGINTFGDIPRALAEMSRVVRPGGKVVVGDEGIAPWLADRRYGRILVNANALYDHAPPLDAVPEDAADVRVQWILGAAFYVLDFRVGTAPFVDVDLPIPGKGDTLRSRFENRG